MKAKRTESIRYRITDKLYKNISDNTPYNGSSKPIEIEFSKRIKQAKQLNRSCVK